jgi:hypothetical protein
MMGKFVFSWYTHLDWKFIASVHSPFNLPYLPSLTHALQPRS